MHRLAVVAFVITLTMATGGTHAPAIVAGATQAGRANLWVDPGGGSCQRRPAPTAYIAGAACADLAAAYSSAAADDVVLVRGGSYGRQVLPEGSKRLAIRNAPGAVPVFGTTSVAADNVTLKGVRVVRTDDPGPFVATLDVTGSNNVLDRVHVDSRFMATPGTTQGRQGIHTSGDRNVFRNGSTFNVVDEKGALIGGTGVTFDGFDFHDVRATHPLVHNECAYSLAPRLTVRNSRFWNCATMDLFIERGTWFGQPLYCCVTLENNVFEHSTSNEPGSWHHYSLGIHGGDLQELRNWRVVNNTFETAVSGGGTPAPGTLWANNIGGWTCFAGATFVKNVGTKCGPTDRAVTPASSCAPPACGRQVTAPYRWVDPAAHDFRLRSGSPAIDRADASRAPEGDIDGTNRPLGGAPDAGAYEYGTGVIVAPVGLAGAVRAFERRTAANLVLSLGPDRGYGWAPEAGVAAAGVGTNGVRRLRDVEVVVLDSARASSAQTTWLQRVLAASTQLPRIVVLRDAPYSCGASAGSAAARARWGPLFKRFGVRLVVGGGVAGYERLGGGRPTYVVGGSGVAAASGRCPAGAPRRVRAKAVRSFVHLTVAGGVVRGRALDAAGRTIDRFVVR